MQSQASRETARCSGQGEPGIQAERRGLRPRGAPPMPRLSKPRPQALEFRPPLPPGTESRDPGRAGGGWFCFLCPRGASLARYRQSRAVARPGFPLLLAPADAPANRGPSQGALPFALHSPAPAARVPPPRLLRPAGPGRKNRRPSSGQGARREVRDGEQGAAGHRSVVLRGDQGYLCG